MSKILKVSDQTHELVMSLRGDGETVDDVLQRQLSAEQLTPVQGAENIGMDSNGVLRPMEIGKPVAFCTDGKKNMSEATPQDRVSRRKVAGTGGKLRSAEDTFTPADSPQPLEQPCCAGKSPCKHWTYEANEMMYVNSLSGRRKAPQE